MGINPNPDSHHLTDTYWCLNNTTLKRPPSFDEHLPFFCVSWYWWHKLPGRPSCLLDESLTNEVLYYLKKGEFDKPTFYPIRFPSLQLIGVLSVRSILFYRDPWYNLTGLNDLQGPPPFSTKSNSKSLYKTNKQNEVPRSFTLKKNLGSSIKCP